MTPSEISSLNANVLRRSAIKIPTCKSVTCITNVKCRWLVTYFEILTLVLRLKPVIFKMSTMRIVTPDFLLAFDTKLPDASGRRCDIINEVDVGDSPTLKP